LGRQYWSGFGFTSHTTGQAMTPTRTTYTTPAGSRLLASIAALLLAGASMADEPADEGTAGDGAWEMSDLQLKLRAKNATSAYSMPVTREMETLLLHTVDPDRPGIAFRCEKGRLYALLAVRPVDLEKALREGVRRPRDWPLTWRVDDGEPVTEDWVSMSNSRLFMAHELASTAAIFRAARDGGVLTIIVKGWDPVTVEIPESDDALFDYYIESCSLDSDYDPNAGA
jgi:hypothetical protein